MVPTSNPYVPALRNLQQVAAANGSTAIPVMQAEFFCFLETQAEKGPGSAQTKVRMCAIDAASRQAAGAEVPRRVG